MWDIPWALVPNKIVRYPGGREIDRFRGIYPGSDDGRPEAWVGSVTSVIGAAPGPDPYDGRAEVLLPDGRRMYLHEAIALDPSAVLGARHRAVSGDGLGMLVKLLDAQLQLGLQCHPSREYAQAHFDSFYGKQECWYILGLREDVDEPPYVYLGFKPDTTPERFAAAYDAGDIRAMEECCHKVRVQVGELYFLGAGVPHAVGPGCFLAEVQEPSDITVGAHRLKTSDPGCTDAQERQHRQRLLGAYSYDPASYEENLRRWKVEPDILRQGDWGSEYRLIGPEQTKYFSVTRLDVRTHAALQATGFPMIAIVLNGSATLRYEGGERAVRQADELFFPYQVTDASVEAGPEGVSILFAHPPVE